MIAPVLEWVDTDDALAFAVTQSAHFDGDQMDRLELALIEALHHGDIRARFRHRSKNENSSDNNNWKNRDKDFWFGLESLPSYYRGNVDEEIEINLEDLRRWLNPTPAVSPGARDKAPAKGRSKPRLNPWLQDAIQRIVGMLRGDGIQPTSAAIWDWLCDNGQEDNRYEFDPVIEGCDYLYVDGDTLHFQNHVGNQLTRKRRSFDRHFTSAMTALAQNK